MSLMQSPYPHPIAGELVPRLEWVEPDQKTATTQRPNPSAQRGSCPQSSRRDVARSLYPMEGRRRGMAACGIKTLTPRAKIVWLGTFGDRGLALAGRLGDGWIPSLGMAPRSGLASSERVLDAAHRPAEIRSRSGAATTSSSGSVIMTRIPRSSPPARRCDRAPPRLRGARLHGLQPHPGRS
jgi:hypothetical protein